MADGPCLATSRLPAMESHRYHMVQEAEVFKCGLGRAKRMGPLHSRPRTPHRLGRAPGHWAGHSAGETIAGR